jgi:transcriptional regulator with GAF, ATPase, and Fis domain
MNTEPTCIVLLRASALMYLFRTLATTSDPSRQSAVESQIVRVLEDLIPCNGGVVLLARNESELAAAARDRELETVARQVIESGIIAADRLLAAPLYVRGAVQGIIVLNSDDAAARADTFSATATLASMAVESARQIEQLQTQTALLREPASQAIVGESGALKRILQMVERVAPQDITVLILGESGTGKELIARAIHEKSRRADQPFVAINCAALTETLLESELFGHEKGAFTGAATRKSGKLEMAEGGTVFLDEIGEMAPALQAKLLRVLQEREFERVGGTQTLRLDVRVIAATNRDLAVEAREGRFREDLYHRLNVVALRTPPLRERKDDIPALAAFFLQRAAAKCRRRVAAISPEAEDCLVRYSWPGNVRELENAIERAVVLGDSGTVLPEDLPESLFEAPAANSTLAGAYLVKVGDAKRDAIVRAWSEARGDYRIAAQSLGLHPNSLLRLIRNLGLRDELERAANG